MSIEIRMKALLGEKPTLREATEQVRKLVDASAWEVRQKRLSVSKELTPKDVEQLVAEVSGQDLKAAMKKARQLGRDFHRVWDSPNGRSAHESDDDQFKALMLPFESARKLLKHPEVDLSHEAVRKFEAALKAESKLGSAWKAGFTEMEKLYVAAGRQRELDIITASPKGVYHKHDKLNGFWGVAGVEQRLAAETDPEVRKGYENMLALMKAPLVY